MSDLAATGCGGSVSGCDKGGNSILWIIILLCFCGGSGGFGGFGSDSCGCGSSSCDGILPIILLLCCCGGF